jgi:hypothetical protein
MGNMICSGKKIKNFFISRTLTSNDCYYSLIRENPDDVIFTDLNEKLLNNNNDND